MGSLTTYKNLGGLKRTTALPAIDQDAQLHQYLDSIKKFPILHSDEEKQLAVRWLEHQDKEAAHKLVTSHLRLVAKVAMGYRGYGLPIADIISEGNLGLMQAVKKFDHTKGFRLATYAVWWIKASIHEYILHSWSLVKIGTTAAQKKLFFNLKKMKAKILAGEERALNQDEIDSIATELNVPAHEVSSMDVRISSHDSSLNSKVNHNNYGDDDESEFQDFVEDVNARPDAKIEQFEEEKYHKLQIDRGMLALNDRERMIIKARFLQEDPETLEQLAQNLSLSRERVRQIEARAMEKMRATLETA